MEEFLTMRNCVMLSVNDGILLQPQLAPLLLGQCWLALRFLLQLE